MWEALSGGHCAKISLMKRSVFFLWSTILLASVRLWWRGEAWVLDGEGQLSVLEVYSSAHSCGVLSAVRGTSKGVAS